MPRLLRVSRRLVHSGLLREALWGAGLCLLIVGSIYVFWPKPGQSQTDAAGRPAEIPLLQVPLTPANAARIFAEYRELARRENGALWGMRLDAPILFVDEKTRRVVTDQPDAAGVLRPEENVFVGVLPDEVTIGGTVQEWSGTRWVMLPWPMPRAQSERMLMLAHEMFHYFEPRLGIPLVTPTSAHLDTRDGRLWLRLERRALRAALQSRDAERTVAIRDALLFRAHRRTLFPDARRLEPSLEVVEGVAEYTGLRLAYPEREDARQRALMDFDLTDKSESFVHSFAYASGATYALLLDDADPEWRSGINAESDLGEMVRTAMQLDLPADLAAATMQRAAAYDYEALAAQEDRRQKDQEEFWRRCQERYVHGSTLTLPVRDMKFQFDPRAVRAFKNLGRVYEQAKITDAWGILEATGGVMIADDWSRVVVPAPADPATVPLAGDGWRLRLNESWELRAAERAGDLMATEHSKP